MRRCGLKETFSIEDGRRLHYKLASEDPWGYRNLKAKSEAGLLRNKKRPITVNQSESEQVAERNGGGGPIFEVEL